MPRRLSRRVTRLEQAIAQQEAAVVRAMGVPAEVLGAPPAGDSAALMSGPAAAAWALLIAHAEEQLMRQILMHLLMFFLRVRIAQLEEARGRAAAG